MQVERELSPREEVIDLYQLLHAALLHEKRVENSSHLLLEKAKSHKKKAKRPICLLYTSDAADEMD